LAFVFFKITYKESLSILMFSKSLLYFYMLLILCLATWSCANTLLFSLLLRINIASHCSILLSSLPFLHNLSLLIIIKLRHQNYSSSCPSLLLFFLKKKMCVGFKGFLFLMNLSLKLCLFLLSSWSISAYFFFSCDFAPSNGNHFWNKTSRTMA